MMQKEVRAHIIVVGKVQGVGYRAFAQLHATKLGLDGWVQNCPDGTVEIEVEGKKEIIEALLEQLRKGPLFSQVETLQVDWREVNRQTEGFKILK